MKQSIPTRYYDPVRNSECKLWKLFLNDFEHFFVEIPPYQYRRVNDQLHCHENFYELVVVFSGTAVDEYAGNRDFLRPGCVLMYAPGSIHRYVSLNHFQNFNILFDETVIQQCESFLKGQPMFRYFFPNAGERSPILTLSENDLATAIEMLDTIHEEFVVRKTGWEGALAAEFLRTLIYLLRNFEPLENDHTHQSTFHIGRIIRHMEENIAKEHTVADLAHLGNMSESSFRHLFKSVVGCSPIEYLIRLRMKRALLMLPMISRVDELAAMCGFIDYNYFCRQFRKHFGDSPLSVRKKLIEQKTTLRALLGQMLGKSSAPEL